MDAGIPVQHKIDKIRFEFFSPKVIKDMAVAKIVTPELYDKEGYPVDGGLMDIRLGVIDPGLVCKTDGQKLKESLGHFGYIELARPVIHVKFATVILDLLRSTCRSCGRLLIPKQKIAKEEDAIDQAEAEGGIMARLAKVKEVIHGAKAVMQCSHCNAKQFKITVEKPTTFIENEKRISPIEVRTRLEKIPDNDLQVLGINANTLRPEWTVLTVLAIPPVTMRPSITLESGERSEDDLTHKLGDIVRINQRLFENINAGAPEIIIEDLWDLLQYHVTTFFDNEVSQLPPARHRSGQPLKTLTARIKSKEGRIRHNLAGKRTNFSARTVISPDPKLNIGDVGVPRVIAMKLTVPERVTEWNKEYLVEFIKRGPEQYPGANYIIRPDGKRKKITDETKEQLLEEIQPGYIIERHLLDGDVALFNRQPSLHRMSMMCHTVKVLPGLTLRLHPAVCIPYNADFDGDEMNLHVPQTEEARAEAEVLMKVQHHIISPRYGLSIIGCTMEAVTGTYLLTKSDFKLPREEALDILAGIGFTNFSKLPNREVVSGREVFSCCLPDDFNFQGYARGYKPGMENEDTVVLIKDGKLISGVLDKNTLGVGQGLMLRNLHKQYGAELTMKILGNFFNLGNEVMLRYGFSVNIAELDVSENTQKELNAILRKAEEDAKRIIEEYNTGKLDVLPGRTAKETREVRLLELLNKARNRAGEITNSRAMVNSNLMYMIKSGGRGSSLNITQMSGCVGQQAFRGGRIGRGYSGRTLSCFAKNDVSPAARGFIPGGFKHGLKPHELFFMSMTGRDSMMDTALRTPKSGYLYRRLANALQDLKVEYDFTVRDASGKIVEFAYGEDGIDVTKSEGGSINVKTIINRVLED
ncbi:MAG: DNA-directed RNA polymerase subunit A' [archaeon]